MSISVNESCLKLPKYWSPSAWTEHVPFAFWLVDKLKPRVYVELGIDYGMSYFAVCQIVDEKRLGTRCYAVDPWCGDEHSGFYPEEVFKQVEEYNRLNYDDFSNFLRMRFDQALDHVPDGSVDLLHVDGRHFYDDVKEDFESWIPKLSERAVVMFHDTEGRENGFGVWKYWAELAGRFPSFNFLHGHGLGVIAFGPKIDPALTEFFAASASADATASFRHIFMSCGKNLSDQWAQRIQHATDNQRLEALQGELEKWRGESSTALSADLRMQLAQARGKPLRIVRDYLKYSVSKRILKLGLPLSEKRRARLVSSVVKRHPKRSLLSRDDILAQIKTPAQQLAEPGRPLSRPLDRDLSLSVPFTFDCRSPVPRFAVILHIYNALHAAEFRSYLENIRYDFDIFISTTDKERKESIEKVFSGFCGGRCEVRIFKNRGRDIAPKLIGFRDVYEHYEFVLHIHAKESVHASMLYHWRQFLIESLIGDQDIVRSVFEIFFSAPKVGLIAPQHFEPMAHWVDWGGNFDIANKLARRMGFSLDPAKPVDFPAGSMFWARSDALKPLLDLNLTFDDFPEEPVAVDGTIAHAIERLYFFAAERRGYDWLKISRPQFFLSSSGIMHASTSDDVRRFANKYALRLLDPQVFEPKVLRDPFENISDGLRNAIQRHCLGDDRKINDQKVAVGIVTYNTSTSELLRAIDSVRLAMMHAGLDTNQCLYVLDNGNSSDAVAPSSPLIVRCESRGNVGFGSAHNRLMGAAFKKGADTYIALNPDGALHPEAIKGLLQVLEANGRRALVEAIQFPLEHQKPYDPCTLDTPWASGACLAIPKAAFLELGGFDEQFFMYCEDVDLSWRALAAGIPVKLCPRALFFHAVTNRTVRAETLSSIYQSGTILARKWGSSDFEEWLQGKLRSLGASAPDLHPTPVPAEWRRFANFKHDFSFAQPRW